MPDTRAIRAALVLSSALLAGLSQPRAADRLRVIASVPNLGSIAAAVGAERIDLTVIAIGSQDAHFVDPKPSFITRMRKADLLLINGLDLEIGWIPPLTEGARNARLLRGADGYIDCSIGVELLEVPSNLSRAEGDVHPYGNPHYLTDPLNAEIVARTIAAALTAADPGSAAAYEERRKAFTERLHKALFGEELVAMAGGSKLAREARAGTLDAFLDGTSLGGSTLRSRLGGWLGALAPFRGRPIVTYHKDYSYFENRFGLRIVELVEPKPGISPSPRHLEELTQLLSKGEVSVIISRPYLEHRSTDLLEERTGVPTITLPLEVGGAKGADDYVGLFDHVTSELARALARPAGGSGR
jgi:ABC-type Zn uptake system ZnuABC Zn-binding protein ZnuA